MRGNAHFDDLATYRKFIDEIVSRKNARILKRIEAELAHLQPLPLTRACDYEETRVYVTSSGGFTLRKVFYSVPSRLIGHRLRVRLYDDRLQLYLGGTQLLTLTRGRGRSSPSVRTKKAGQPLGCSWRWPSTKFPSAIDDASNVTWGEAKLLPGKTLDTFDFDSVPRISKAHVAALCAGDSWLEKGANLILIGPPGVGKSHLPSAIGLALLEKGYRVSSAAPRTWCRSCRSLDASSP